MPVVLLKYDQRIVLARYAAELAKALPDCVARALDFRGSQVKPADIEVWVTPSNRADVNIKPISIIIWIHAYRARIRNLDKRQRAITDFVKKYFEGYGFRNEDDRGWVWIRPSKSSLGSLRL